MSTTEATIEVNVSLPVVSLDDHQRFVKDSSFYVGCGSLNRDSLTYLALGMAGECGETSNIVKKIVRDALNHSDLELNLTTYRAKLLEELGDVLWYYNGLCDILGVRIEELAAANIVKLCQRHKLPWLDEHIKSKTTFKPNED